MLRHALPSLSLVSLAFASCASIDSNELLLDHAVELRPATVSQPAIEPSAPTVPAAAATLPAEPALEPTPEPLLEPAALSFASAQEESLRHSRFTIKAGVYSVDADELSDDGWIVNASWMRFFTSLLALEFEVGYFDASGEDGLVDGDIWGMPVMVNGRLNLPLWILDLYGGLGVGVIYFDGEFDGGGVDEEDDGFLLGGNAFLGATINVADAVALGLEAKMYATEESDDLDESLDAFALMLTLGFSR